MSDPKIKVGADVGGVTSGIQRVGQAATEANKQAERSLQRARKELQGYTGDVEKARRAFEALQKSGARGTRNLRGQTFESYTGGGWQNASVNDAEAARLHRDVMRRVGLSGGPGGGQSAFGFGGHSLYVAGRGVMQSAFPVGGVGGGIIQGGYHAARAAPGGLWSGGGLARLGMGTGIGLAAFGAIKGIRSIAGKVGQAEDESSNYADLVRQVGAASTSFGELRDSIRQATAGMGLAYNEAAKLAATYAHEAGMGPRSRASLAAEVGGAASFARGFGLDPQQGARFFGAMRHTGVSSGESDNRKLALQIGDAVASKGEFSRAGELIDAVHSFVQVSARGLTVGNVGGFLGATNQLGALGIPGLGLSESAGLAGRMDSGFRSLGGGEAGQNMLLSMLQRVSPDATANDLAAVQAGGFYARGSDVFGTKSGQYLAAKGRGDTAEMERLSRMSQAFGGTTMGNHLTGQLVRQGMGTQATIQALSALLGLSAPEAAAALASFSAPGGGSKLSDRLASLGVDTTKMNGSNIGLMAALQGGGRDMLMEHGKDLLGRKGSAALSSEERAKMIALLGGSDTEGLRDHVMKLSATRGNESEGDQLRRVSADLGNIYEAIASKALPLLTNIRDAAVGMAEKFGLMPKGSLDGMRGAEARATMESRLASAASPGEKYRMLADALSNSAGTGDEYQQWLGSQLQALGGVAGDGGGARSGSASRIYHRASGRTKYDSMFAAAAARTGVPIEVLKAIAAKESNFDPNAVSAMNANGTQDFGIMQHNSAYLASRGMTKETAMDPATNINAGADLLSQLYRKHGNWADAIRAYNGSGPNAEAYRDSVYPTALQLAKDAGHPLDGSVPGGGGDGGGNYSHEHTVAIRLLRENGTPAAEPVKLALGSPKAAGTKR